MHHLKHKLSLAILVGVGVGLTACSNEQSTDTHSATQIGAQLESQEIAKGKIGKIGKNLKVGTAGKQQSNATADITAAPQFVDIGRTSPALTQPMIKQKIMSQPTMQRRMNDHYGQPQPIMRPPHSITDREKYDSFDPNPIKLVSRDPVSTFGVDVDTAAYSNIRRMLTREGRLPPKAAVKIEEMINYFNYDYPTPNNTEQPFSLTTELAQSPWNKNKQLMLVGISAYQEKFKVRPAANLVFLVDVSGSMQAADKLPLLKKSLRLLVKKMGPQDTIALAVYAGAAGVVLEATSANQKAKILTAIDQLQAGGSTNGSAGIQLAYQLAQQNYQKSGINRVIIASDGDMNVGTIDQEQLKTLIAEKRKSGVGLTTLGFGSGNYNYALMEQLADVGNGNAVYIDSLKEAQKVLVEEMQSSLLTVAHDVKIQVEFNPQKVSEYRLIGYENRVLNNEDFSNDNVDAGDIGAGHTVTALYEISLSGQAGALHPKLRYQQTEPSSKPLSTSEELAFVKLRYKTKIGGQSLLLHHPVPAQANDFSQASNNLRFSAAVAGFGQLLAGGKYTQNWGYQDALKLVRSTRSKDPHGYRSELISLVTLANSLSTPVVMN